jgi:hypothetical protein
MMVGIQLCLVAAMTELSSCMLHPQVCTSNAVLDQSFQISVLAVLNATIFVHVCSIFTDLYVNKYCGTIVVCYSYCVHNVGLF